MREKAIKSGTLTIKDSLAHMHIADDDDACAPDIVSSSDFEDATSTYFPGFAQLSFHMMD